MIACTNEPLQEIKAYYEAYYLKNIYNIIMTVNYQPFRKKIRKEIGNVSISSLICFLFLSLHTMKYTPERGKDL